jgi:hypothetical protein
MSGPIFGKIKKPRVKKMGGGVKRQYAAGVKKPKPLFGKAKKK